MIKAQYLKGTCEEYKQSGVTGVAWHPRVNKWRAYINFGGYQYHLGVYDDIADAVSVIEETHERWISGYITERRKDRECRREIQRKLKSQEKRTVEQKQSGVPGVAWKPHLNKWGAHVSFNQHSFHLGFYYDIADAVSIVEEARERWISGYITKRRKDRKRRRKLKGKPMPQKKRTVKKAPPQRRVQRRKYG
jgi:ribosomal protein S17E